MKKYFLKVRANEDNTASLKAKIDIEQILSKDGFNKLYDTNSKIRKFKLIIACVKLLFNKDAIIVTQYPFITSGELSILKKVKKIIGFKMVSIIHDVNSLRDVDDNTIDKEKEINFFNENDCIISHNEHMTKWFRENGVKTKIVNLQIFDYLSDKIYDNKNINNFKNVCFAGNLSENKSKFIYSNELKNLNFKLKLYGPNFEDIKDNENIEYRGVFPPDELACQFESGFGLIWDGTSVSKCDGINGEYLKYNNPHKTSLYLSSGLPVIIWSEAALAGFIDKYNVGFKLNSLEEIEKILNNMTVEEYEHMLINVKKVQKKLLNGYFTINAINECIDKLK